MPLRLVFVVPVVAVSPIWNRHLHKPGSINARVNSTPLRIVTSAATGRSLQVEAGALTGTRWWSVMGDVLCSQGINPQLKLAFQLNNSHLVNRDTPLKGFEYRTFDRQKCGRVHTMIISSDPIGFQRARLALGQISWKVSDNDQLSHSQEAHA
jgi:hypothetical protein